jgi:hypothetical protein
MSTISKQDAEALSSLLSYAIDGRILPFETGKDDRPTDGERILLEELGIAGHPSKIGGMVMNLSVRPTEKTLLLASHRGILIENNTKEIVKWTIAGQVLTTPAQELVKIANSPPTDIEYLKNVAKGIYTELRSVHATDIDGKLLAIHVVATTPVGDNQFKYDVIYAPE